MSNLKALIEIPNGASFYSEAGQAVPKLRSRFLHPKESFWNLGSGSLAIEHNHFKLCATPVNLDVRNFWLFVIERPNIRKEWTLCSFAFENNPSYFRFDQAVHEINLLFPECFRVSSELAWQAVEYFLLNNGAMNPSLIWETRSLSKVPAEVWEKYGFEPGFEPPNG